MHTYKYARRNTRPSQKDLRSCNFLMPVMTIRKKRRLRSKANQCVILWHHVHYILNLAVMLYSKRNHLAHSKHTNQLLTHASQQYPKPNRYEITACSIPIHSLTRISTGLELHWQLISCGGCHFPADLP